VDYHWLEGKFDRLPALMADLVRRGVAVIATPAGNYAAQVAKAATTAIPIVFGVGGSQSRCIVQPAPQKFYGSLTDELSTLYP
jgi:ABC-type uncharacterized transport system substrate-binding protein